MLKAGDLLRQGRTQELWNMCCGYLHMSLDETMAVQHRLMADQLNLLNDSALGRKLFRGHQPATVDEFRRAIPLTVFDDYCPELMEQQEAALPAPTAQWVHTSGRSDEYQFKWLPMSVGFQHELSVVSYGVGILAGARYWGDAEHLPPKVPRMIYAVAPRPYFSGAIAAGIGLQTPLRFLPPIEIAETMAFEERIHLAFKEALETGFDYFFGMSMVLATIGERFSESSRLSSLLPLLKRPRTAARVLKAALKSRLARRPLMPRDLWNVRGIICSGLDSFVYRETIKKYWGRYPLDLYAGTEGGIYATQAWDYGSMTFVPSLNFFEFIPEDEVVRYQMDASYRPRTVLLDEVRPGERYEVVITNFHGGSLVRYRPGDTVKITSMDNAALGIMLPQMEFDQRVDGSIDFAVIRLSEKSIWSALEELGVPYEEWIAYKSPGNQSLSLFIELKNGHDIDERALGEAVCRILTREHYTEADEPVVDDTTKNMVGFSVNVTRLAGGTFSRYTAGRQAEGADLAHLKPPHVNPSEKVLATLLTDTRRAADTPPSNARIGV
jgi:hypothetical protein